MPKRFDYTKASVTPGEMMGEKEDKILESKKTLVIHCYHPYYILENFREYCIHTGALSGEAFDKLHDDGTLLKLGILITPSGLTVIKCNRQDHIQNITESGIVVCLRRLSTNPSLFSLISSTFSMESYSLEPGRYGFEADAYIRRAKFTEELDTSTRCCNIDRLAEKRGFKSFGERYPKGPLFNHGISFTEFGDLIVRDPWFLCGVEFFECFIIWIGLNIEPESLFRQGMAPRGLYNTPTPPVPPGTCPHPEEGFGIVAPVKKDKMEISVVGGKQPSCTKPFEDVSKSDVVPNVPCLVKAEPSQFKGPALPTEMPYQDASGYEAMKRQPYIVACRIHDKEPEPPSLSRMVQTAYEKRIAELEGQLAAKR